MPVSPAIAAGAAIAAAKDAGADTAGQTLAGLGAAREADAAARGGEAREPCGDGAGGAQAGGPATRAQAPVAPGRPADDAPAARLLRWLRLR